MSHWFIRLVTLACLFLTATTFAAPNDYWQQEVNYKMDVTLHSDLRTIHCTCRIEYINNSPDTLHELYIKAFPNAVHRGSYADLKARKTGDYSLANLSSKEEGGIYINRVTFYALPTPSGEDPNRFETLSLGNTICEASVVDAEIHSSPTGSGMVIDKTLEPFDSTTLQFEFTTVLPSPHSMRMGLYGGVAKAAYWYPQVCVYDRKLGWNNGEYLGWGECYGDYGKFEVNITAPEDVIVAATGACVNEAEVLPDSLKAKLALENFLKPRSEWPKFAFDSTGEKTWKFVAENVNDFAFVASRDYCIDWDTTGNTEVVAYALRKNAKAWKSATKDGIDAITILSEKFIPYQYPVMRICDAFGGMEFPMLVHCAGGPPSPGWYIVVYHEIAHNWFMGMIGSNQTDRPFLDEGFTTHAEHVVMEKYRGRQNVPDRRTWYARAFAPTDEDRMTRGFRPLLQMMSDGYDKPMVFSYDQGEEYFPYRVSAYYKTAAMHYNLRAILGDSAYFSAMQDYCRDWLFKHPYEEDFAASMEKSTGLQLDAFFQQWFYGRQRLDYGVKKIKRTSKTTAEITLENRGRLVTPVPVAVIFNTGDTSFYMAPPEGMSFSRPGYTTLPTWNQFRRFDDQYTFSVNDSRKVDRVVVDPENLLMDIDRSNNRSGLLPPIEFRFDNMKYDRVPVNAYALRWRPDFWYDKPNGAQIGGHLHGSYLGKLRKFSLDARYSIESKLPFVDFKGSSPFVSVGTGPDLSYRFLLADHRLYTRGSFQTQAKKLWSRPDRETLKFDLEYLRSSHEQRIPRSNPPDELLPFVSEPNWDGGNTYRFTFSAGLYRAFRYSNLSLTAATSVGTHSYTDASRGFLENDVRFSLSFPRSGEGSSAWLQTRLFYLNMGGHPPSQMIQHLSRASAYEQFVNSQLFRSPGTFPLDWRDEFYYSAERVRGYQDRLVYLARSYGGSLELTPLKRLPLPLIGKLPLVGRFLSRANLTFFADAATVSMDKAEFDYRTPISASETRLNNNALYTSGGVSITLPPVWSNHFVRLDFPLILNKPLPDEDQFAFRFSVAWIQGK